MNRAARGGGPVPPLAGDPRAALRRRERVGGPRARQPRGAAARRAPLCRGRALRPPLACHPRESVRPRAPRHQQQPQQPCGLLDNLKRHDEAKPMLRRAVAIREGALGDKHPDVATSMHNLASHHLDVQEWQAAYAMFKRATAIWIARSGGRASGVLRQDERAEIKGHADPFLGFVIAAYHVAEGADGKTASDCARKRSRPRNGSRNWAAAGHLGHVGACCGWRRPPWAAGPDAAGPGRGGSRRRPRADRRRFPASTGAQIRSGGGAASAGCGGSPPDCRRWTPRWTSFPQYASLTSAAPLPLTEVGSLARARRSAAAVRSDQGRHVSCGPSHRRREPLGQGSPRQPSARSARVAALRCGLDFSVEWQRRSGGQVHRSLAAGGRCPTDADGAALRPCARTRTLRCAAWARRGSDRRQAPPDRALGRARQPAVSMSWSRNRRAVALPADVGGYAQAAWLAKRAAITVLPSVASLKALRQLRKAEPGNRRLHWLRQPAADGQRRHRPAAWAKQSCSQRLAGSAAPNPTAGTPPAKLLRSGLANVEEAAPPAAAARNGRRALRGGAPAGRARGRGSSRPRCHRAQP